MVYYEIYEGFCSKVIKSILIRSVKNCNLITHILFKKYSRVLSDENLLKEPLSTRQLISSTLDKICMCTSNDDQCSYNKHCSKTVEKKFLCTDPSIKASVSRKKRDLSQKWIPSSLTVVKSLVSFVCLKLLNEL